MKLKFILLLTLCFLYKNSKSQYLPVLTSDQYWEQFQGNASICNWYAGQLVSLDSDTVFLGNTYKKVFENPIYSTNSQGQFCAPYYVNTSLSNCVGYVREDTTLMKVFLGDPVNGMEYVIYDFSASDGDTLQDYYGLPDMVIVDSARVLNYPILGDRNTYYVSFNGAPSDFNFYIEGIGGINGFLKPLTPLASGSQELTCVRDSSFSSIFGSCMSMIVGNETLNKLNINFITNRNTNMFSLKTNELIKHYTLLLFNSDGKLLYNREKLQANIEYSFPALNTSIIFYRIEINEGEFRLTGSTVIK